MLAIINNEFDKDFKMVVFSHKDGFQVQLVDGIELGSDDILGTVKDVREFGKKYGFDVSEQSLIAAEFNNSRFVEDQSLAH